MSVKEEKICRLCLSIVDNEFEIIDEIKRKMFDILLLSVNLDISKDPIVCNNCAEVVKKCFNFKSICMETEKLLCSFAIGGNIARFDLKNIYKTGKDMDTADEDFVCRFCMQNLTENNFMLLDTLMQDVMFVEMLRLLPKTDFNIIKNPIICMSCRLHLECYITFVEKCLDIEGKISNYCQNKCSTSTTQIKLSDVLHYTIKHNSLFDSGTQIHAIKKEEDSVDDITEALSEVYDPGIIKVEALVVKDDIVNFNENETKYLETLKVHRSINNSCSDPTKENYSVCMCDTICRCSITHDMQPIEMQMYKCAVCSYNTQRKDHLIDHVLNHEPITKVKKMYKCTVCTHQTKHNDNLKRHMLIHKDITEVEMYKCSMCTFATKHKYSLNQHMIIHTGITKVDMHKCLVCTYQTKRKDYLKQHLLTHKVITDVEMYKCAICTYEAKCKSYLKQHMLIHKDKTEVKLYKCSMCTYEAKRKYHLKNHMLIHEEITNVELHKCTMCTYQTKRKDHLKQHLLIHKEITEVKMYKCSMCTFETKRKDSLKKHKKTHKI